MKTFVVHNGVQLENGTEFTHNGQQYRFFYPISEDTALVDKVGFPASSDYYREGQLGLSFHHMPGWFIMNRRTGAAVSTRDTLPNGYRVERALESAVQCTNGIRYTPSSMSKQVDFIPITRYDQRVPVVPEYKRGCEFDPARNTGHMLVDGEWRPYREVRQLDGKYYWEGDSIVIDGRIFPLSETVVGWRGSRIPLAEAVDFDGVFYPEALCTTIDGTRYPTHLCIKVVDSYGSLVETRSPHASLDGLELCRWIGSGTDTYAALVDVSVVDCGGYHPANDLYDWYGCDYPQQWIDDNTFVCDGCGDRFHNDDYDADGRCTDCYDNYGDEEDDSRIRDCSCRSAARFTPEEDVPLKFGIEFEVESRSGGRSELLDHFDDALPSRYAIYKSDGSLDDYTGVEIVTRPDSPAVHKRVWRKALDDNAQRLLNISSNCGIHIHVSRASLSPLRIGRMLVFINEPGNESLIRSVAGRYNGSYCAVSRGKKLSDGKRSGYSRYDGLNLTNDKTIEFRLFDSRSSRTPDGFIKNIEFVEALLAFTNIAESGNRSLDTASFLKFLSRRRKDFPTLHKFLIPEPVRRARPVDADQLAAAC